jgi:hypothetical protein
MAFGQVDCNKFVIDWIYLIFSTDGASMNENLQQGRLLEEE